MVGSSHCHAIFRHNLLIARSNLMVVIIIHEPKGFVVLVFELYAVLIDLYGLSYAHPPIHSPPAVYHAVSITRGD